MATSVREFLESYAVHEKLYTPVAAKWHGEWPEVVEGHCRVCDATRSYSIWPSKVAGFAPEWGVYMLSGACESCGTAGLLFWVEVNQREGWIQKAGQLPAPALQHAEAN
ncbi:MAG TPA: hypothetical protein VF882_03860 [Gemmatimonadales bacterium]